jgi:REP element-mobilizing transposase RayT
MARPPRLSPDAYRNHGACFLTLCTYHRAKVFVDPARIDLVWAQFLRAAAGCDVSLAAYCFMPDHLHYLAERTQENADVHESVQQAKQRSGYFHVQSTGQRLWQPGYYDRVLREREDPLHAIAYMVANPVRAGLVSDASLYPYWDVTGYGRADVLDAIACMPMTGSRWRA